MRRYFQHPRTGEVLSLALTGTGRWTDSRGRSHRLGTLKRAGWSEVTEQFAGRAA